MKDLEIRTASRFDTEKVQRLCRLLYSEDYAVDAWPQWMEHKEAVNLVALCDGELIACWHAEPLTQTDAWSQGTRVHPAFQGKGIGSLMLDRLELELRGRHFRVIRGSIAPDNIASLTMVRSKKWSVHSSVCRRLCEPHQIRASAVGPADWKRISHIAEKFPFLGSRQHHAHFARSYFTLTDNPLRRLVGNEAVFVSEDNRACAVLDDAYRSETGDWWVVGISGDYQPKLSLIKGLLSATYKSGINLLFDSPCQDQVQHALTELGFEPVLPNGRYVIVERWL